MSSPSNVIAQEKGLLSSFKSKYLIISKSEYASQIVDEIIKSLDNLNEVHSAALKSFFDDLNIEAPFGDEINLIKGNSYSEYIEKEYKYGEIRVLVWDNLSKYSEDSGSAAKIENLCSSFEERLDVLQENYDNWKDENGEESDGENLLKEFWDSHFEELRVMFEPLKELVILKSNENQRVEDLINEWITLGDMVMEKVSKVSQIYDLSESEISEGRNSYEELKKNIGTISQISPGIVENFNVSESIKPKYSSDVFPPPPIVEKVEIKGETEYHASASFEISKPADFTPPIDAIKKEVLEILEVKKQSESIHSQLEGIFNSI